MRVSKLGGGGFGDVKVVGLDIILLPLIREEITCAPSSGWKYGRALGVKDESGSLKTIIFIWIFGILFRILGVLKLELL